MNTKPIELVPSSKERVLLFIFETHLKLLRQHQKNRVINAMISPTINPCLRFGRGALGEDVDAGIGSITVSVMPNMTA